MLDQLKIRLSVQLGLYADRPRALEHLGIFNGGVVMHGVGRSARYAFVFVCQMPRKSCASCPDFAADGACAQVGAATRRSTDAGRIISVLRSPAEGARRRAHL